MVSDLSLPAVPPAAPAEPVVPPQVRDRDPRRWWALFALVPAVLCVGLDGTVLSVALPTLAQRLDASTGALQWFVIAYTLAFAAALVPAGVLGDRWGRKPTLLVALGVFGLASLACALATGPASFIAARALLGLGGAAILPVALAMLPTLFDDDERPRAVTTLMAVTMLGFPIGPLLGGWLLAHAWWGWVFLMNLPVVVAGAVAVAVLLPPSRGSAAGRLDVPGVLTSAACLALVSWGFTRAGEHGWTSPGALALLVAGALAGVAFVAGQRRRPGGLVDLRLFASPAFRSGTAVAVAVSFVMFGLLFAVPQLAAYVRGADAQGAGLRLLPLIVGMIAAALPAEKVAARTGARPVVVTGLALLAAALAWGALTPAGAPDLQAAGWVALAGAGLGLSLPIAMDAALGALPADASGAGSALLQALRMVGGSFGAALLGGVLNAGYRAHLPGAALAALPPEAADAVRSSVGGGAEVAAAAADPSLAVAVREAFVSGTAAMLAVCALVALAVAVLAAITVPDTRSGAQGAGSGRELHA
ncbi:MAG: MFS transporter [Kineosporiaceae bacterium]